MLRGEDVSRGEVNTLNESACIIVFAFRSTRGQLLISLQGKQLASLFQCSDREAHARRG